jgi:hypothetical protein
MTRLGRRREKSAIALTSARAHLVSATLLAVFVPHVVLAQDSTTPARSGVQARVAAAAVYDDNVFWRSDRTGDFIWRLSPEFAARRESVPLSFAAACTFDAEAFHDHPELSTALARLRSTAGATIRPSSRTTLAIGGSFARTSTPGDLNLTTGLGNGRIQAVEWRGDSQLTHALTPVMAVDIGYEFSRQALDASIDIETHNVAMSLARRLSARSDVRVKSVSTRFVFNPGLTVYAQGATLSWGRRLTDTATVTLEGGPRYTLGRLRPDIVAALVRRSGNRHMSLSYGSGQTVAVGVLRPIDVRRVQSEIVYRPAMGTSAAVHGAVFVNSVGADVATVYRFSAAFERRLSSTLSFGVGYATDLQRGILDVVPSDELPRGRNVVSMRLVAFPSMR